MRGRPPPAVALSATVALLALLAGPAAATPFTTPIPVPVDPDRPVASARPSQAQSSPVVADAGGGLAVIRVLPDTAPATGPASGSKDPARTLEWTTGEVGIGLSTAQVNSQAFPDSERAVAQAAPIGLALAGRSPQAPGSLAQSAPPDNPRPTVGGLSPPSSPLDTLFKVGLLNGSVHARWNDRTGPCVDPIVDASTSLASLSAVTAIPSLPGTPDLSTLIPAGGTSKLGASDVRALVDGVTHLSGPLSQLGGLLGGANSGALLRLPDVISSESTVRLVDVPGAAGRAVRSTSTVRLASIQLFAGTGMEIRVDVISQPELVATATGDPNTSTISYQAPVLRVSQGGRVLGRLDTATPKLDVPIGIPVPGSSVPGQPDLGKLPLIGTLLPSGSPIPTSLKKLDIGVLRLQVGELNQKASTLPARNGQPEIAAVGALARLLDLQILPTDALPLPNLPSVLVQMSIGEQAARAAAPAGGVVCQVPEQPTGAPPPAQRPRALAPLAYTTAAYHVIPIFWTGAALLLAGVIIAAAAPPRRPAGSPKPEPAANAEPAEVRVAADGDDTSEM